MSSILTVTQLNKYLKFKLQSDVKLKGVAVKGEVCDLSINYRSGHIYFSVKDEGALLKCVMFASSASKLRFEPEDGMNVLAIGNIDIYERGGVYQLIVSQLQPLGAGEAKVGLDQLKKKLAEKGVFDTSKKKMIPLMPRKLAVVTSPTGAAVRDIINVLGRRFPLVRVEIYPAVVQGEAAPKSISEALKRADRSGADTIILARGGGSDDELMAFNTELVTMAVYECITPVISAVGHEIDTTLCDYAADMRAPTPSAAAELAVPDISELKGTFDIIRQKLDTAASSILKEHMNELERLEAELKYLSPERKINESIALVSGLSERLDKAVYTGLSDKSKELDSLALQLAAFDPFGVLERGYTIITKNNTAVTSVKELTPGDSISVRFSDGQAEADITKVN